MGIWAGVADGNGHAGAPRASTPEFAVADATREDFSQAFDVLYPLAVRMAARIVGDQSTAEDVAAEALARAYARWAKVGSLPYRDAWVMRVASNVAIDTVRKRQPVQTPALASTFEDATAVRLALAAALAKLPARQREAVVLRYIAGYSEADVSAALGISVNSVKTHVSRGLASLRTRLDRTGGSGCVVL
jgi:RNA polymerase sigma factor (sigma-70 family)